MEAVMQQVKLYGLSHFVGHNFRQDILNLYLPDFHKVKSARRRRTLQFKVGEVKQNLHVDLHSDLVDTVSVGRVVGRVVGRTEGSSG